MMLYAYGVKKVYGIKGGFKGKSMQFAATSIAYLLVMWRYYSLIQMVRRCQSTVLDHIDARECAGHPFARHLNIILFWEGSL